MPCTTAASAACGCRATSICSAVRWALKRCASRSDMAAVLAASSSPSSPRHRSRRPVAETLAQLFQRAQRLRFGLAHQAAMNHGLAVAVDGDDGTGCGLHVRAVVLQAIFQRLQLFAHGFAFLPKASASALSSSSASSAASTAWPVGASALQLRCVRLRACSARAALSAHAGKRAGRHGSRPAWHPPGPTLGADSGGDARQLVLRQPFQQRGIGQIYTRIIFREQVTAHATACGPVAVQPDKAHQRMPAGVDFGQAFAAGWWRCHCGAS